VMTVVPRRHGVDSENFGIFWVFTFFLGIYLLR
jgi:hypothetical protein